MKFEEIMAQLKQKVYHPVYFLTGDEPFYIDAISDHIQEHLLTEAERSFNQTVLYGKEVDAEAVLNAAKRFPMMASHSVVIVKEAQELKDIDQLVHYVEHPLASTVLVLNYKYKKPDKRKAIFKALTKKSVYFESKQLYENQVPDWISSYVSRKGYSIDAKSSALLVEFLGRNLAKVAGEIDKLLITLGDSSKTITPELIERNIGISKDFNNFELTAALGRKDVLTANRIINYFASNQRNYPLVLTINALFSFFSKVMVYHWLKDKSKQSVAAQLGVNPYFVKDYAQAAKLYNANKVITIIELLREYDLKSKGYQGVSMEPSALLKELIFKILH